MKRDANMLNAPPRTDEGFNTRGDYRFALNFLVGQVRRQRGYNSLKVAEDVIPGMRLPDCNRLLFATGRTQVAANPNIRKSTDLKR